MKQINVTKSFIPPLDEYEKYLQIIWANGQLTNQGPLLKQLEAEIQNYLKISNLQLVANGTMALQLALRALDITGGEIITTPFSYVATTSAILWEHCEPVFVDIDPQDLTIDVNKIESAITPNTKAILAVHVFGHPCNIEAIESLALKYDLKVIYDAAHAFGATYNDRSLLDYGDISICSFHATKIFHTIEGGCLVSRDEKVNERIDLLKRFGHYGDEHYLLGINAKATEFQAAMGLCNLRHLSKIISDRKRHFEYYKKGLSEKFVLPQARENSTSNYGYFPIIFRDELSLLDTLKRFEKENIFPRRYFFPALNTLPYVPTYYKCPVAEDISKRVLCLPLYDSLTRHDLDRIITIANRDL